MYLRKWAVPEDILALSKQYGKEIEELEHMFQHRHFPSAIKRQAIAVDNARHTLTNALQGTVISPSEESL
jgi:GTP-sensing pleiotropic transcriptional regulator CodY